MARRAIQAPPPIGAAIHRPFPPALCRCLLQQCSDPTPPACSQIKGFPSPACALWFLGGKGQTSGEAQTYRRCNMGGFCPGYRGVDISGAGQSQNQGHRKELSMSCKHLAPAAFSLLASSVAWPQAWGGACMYLLAGSASPHAGSGDISGTAYWCFPYLPRALLTLDEDKAFRIVPGTQVLNKYCST